LLHGATGAKAAKQYGSGVTDTEIKLGTTSPYSGPASAYGIYGQAQSAYFQMLNEHGASTVERSILFPSITPIIRQRLSNKRANLSNPTRYSRLPDFSVLRRTQRSNNNFNVETNLTRDHQAEAFLDVILEGPSTWKVRPVFETFYDKVWTQGESRSVLVGAIWQVDHDLALDAAFRYAIADGRPINEIRAGFTFAFKEEGDKTPMRPGVTFGNWGLSR
jgi:hypothetical protein